MNYDKRISARYSRLVIVDWYKVRDKSNNIRYYAKCKCDCGVIKDINIDSILSRKTTSCGCFATEARQKNKKHGRSYSVEYKTYHRIKQRCESAKSKNYDNYGGKGIKCLWDSFDEFYKDMGDRPKGKTSIDRIDSEKHYCKDNCRWANQTEQTRNTSRSLYWIIDDVKYESRRHAMKETGLNQNDVIKRAKKVRKYKL